jgi:transposase-like protein
MDTSQQAAVVPKDKEFSVTLKRQRRSISEKRRMVEETLVEGASVARVARGHGVNANQVLYWRKLYQAGRLGTSSAAQLLPQQADLDYGGRDRLAARLHGTEWVGADEVGAESVLRARICVSSGASVRSNI